METKQSLTTASVGLSTFLSFGAKSVRPDVLEKMLIGRQKTADLLEQYVREIAMNGVNQQIFMVGPRGSGKTHLLRVLYHRVQDLVQSRQVVVSYFAEEEYGISGYLDFLIRIINAFMRWYDNDKVYLTEQLDILRETSESRQEDVAETLISEYVSDKPLLILSENFDNILEALGKQGQAKLRAWLYRHNRISIIATAQAISPDLDREDRPFYGFFTPLYLKKLTYEDSLSLLVTLAETEDSQTMLTHLAGKGRSQVRAIHDLVKGNHRLLVTFYQFLKADTLADLSVIFMKTMNDLKPYYETFIRYLPAQQQKILHYIALAKTPQQGTDIGKDCFIPSASLSKQLSELQRRHLIDALTDSTDKRNKLYDVSEPLLRIAIEIGEQKEGITSLFIDFLALYYSRDEIIQQKGRFEKLYTSTDDFVEKQKLYWEIDARDKALRIKIGIIASKDSASREAQNKFILAYELYDKKAYSQAIRVLLEAIKLAPNYSRAWYSLGVNYVNEKDYDNAKYAYNEAIKIRPNFADAWNALGILYAEQGFFNESVNAYQKAIDLEEDNANYWNNLGSAYANKGDYSQAITFYLRSTKIQPDYTLAWKNLGTSYSNLGDYEQAEKVYTKAMKMDPDSASIWYALGVMYRAKGDLERSIDSFKKSVEINPNYIEAWNNLGVTYDQNRMYRQAIEIYKKTIGFDSSYPKAWNNLGTTYTNIGEEEEAITAYYKAIELDPGYHMALSNLSSALYRKGQYNRAITVCLKMIELQPENAGTWNNLGLNYDNENVYDQAIIAYERALELRPNYTLAWGNIGLTQSKLGMYEASIYSLCKAVEIDPSYTSAWNNLGVSYKKAGYFDKAIRSFQESIALNLENDSAFKNFQDLIVHRLKTESVTNSLLENWKIWILSRGGFEVLLSYISVYQKIFVYGEEKAIYGLPKEQREFFEREILKKPLS